MLGNSIYFWRIIRNITTGFASIFSNIAVVRYNYTTNPWTEQQRFLLKLMFGQKEKFIQALQGDPTNSKKVQITLPILAYNFLGLEYDKNRKGQTTLQNYNVTNQGNMISQYAPIPYNFHYQIYIYVREIIDGEQILEQILPFFTPDYSLTINLVPSMNISQAIPVILNSATYELLNEGDNQTSTRYILWTLDFTIMGWLYGPTSSGSVIKEVIANIYNWPEAESDKSIILVLNHNSGNGTYIPGEIVFQGLSIENSNATAIVQDWSNTTNRLLITDAQGMFYTNNILNGSISGANLTIQNYEIVPTLISTITVTPIPPTANIGQPFTYDINIKEVY